MSRFSKFNHSALPRFSIIILVYNVAPYLRECLDSVAAQTFADWEVIWTEMATVCHTREFAVEYRTEVAARI